MEPVLNLTASYISSTPFAIPHLAAAGDPDLGPARGSSCGDDIENPHRWGRLGTSHGVALQEPHSLPPFSNVLRSFAYKNSSTPSYELLIEAGNDMLYNLNSGPLQHCHECDCLLKPGQLSCPSILQVWYLHFGFLWCLSSLHFSSPFWACLRYVEIGWQPVLAAPSSHLVETKGKPCGLYHANPNYARLSPAGRGGDSHLNNPG